MSRLDGRLLPAATLAVALAGWQAFVVASGVPTLILPSPVEVATTLLRTLPSLLGAATVTGATAGLGLLGGVLVGLTLAFVMVSSRGAATVVYPYVVALRIAPLVAIAPLVFLWVGDGLLARALLVATMTPFPVAIGSYDGLRSVPREYTDLARSVGAASWRTFLLVRVPAAAPSVFAGVKLAAVLSVVGAVVAEFLTLDAGLGYRIFHTSRYLQTRQTYAALAVLAVFGYAFYWVPAALERRVRRAAGTE